eukprot:TRINITY_DN125147_c0_g1_i1.p1 TRINITY_DN125147_c0_g1~~TRINITY_DN125147_c0_g1_i1.p1  ORF type:complete len:143 (-),score=28.50 TRINITY_DN125147_c0_g1_i1:89-517(-)
MSRLASLAALLAVAPVADAVSLRSGQAPPTAHFVAANANSTKHVPIEPDTLAEYKDSSAECLSWCGALDNNCFRGCLNDCMGHLGPPPCVAFALEKECHDACTKMEAAYSCLGEVKPSDTHVCHGKLNEVNVPADQKCRLPK